MKRSRGYALVLVLGIALVLTVGIGSMMNFLVAAEKTSARQRLNREAFYVCDGVNRVLSRATSDVLADPSVVATADLAPARTALRTEVIDQLMSSSTVAGATGLSALLPAGYVVVGDGFSFTDVDLTESAGAVRVGRFAGMTGQRRRFAYQVTLRKTNGSACSTSATVDSMRIPFGEFGVFSDEDLRMCASWGADSDVTRFMRWHVNGDLRHRNTALPHVTMTGSLIKGCGTTAPSTGLGFGGKTLAAISNPTTFCFSEASCVTVNSLSTLLAAGIGADRFSDGRRGTSPLHLTPVSTEVQDGRDATSRTATVATVNDSTFRYLIDPGLPADNARVKATRLAHQALIRILDGVWYLDDGTWPGEAIWSDHPGSYTVNAPDSPDEFALLDDGAHPPRKIGQSNIIASSARMPEHYSLFDGELPFDDESSAKGVVSYGRLTLMPSGEHEPRVSTDNSGSIITRARAASRQGFRDRHAAADGQRIGSATGTGNMLPINFDLGQFITALQRTDDDDDENELGERLKRIGRDTERNIIVWIGSTWTGSANGLLNDLDPPVLPSIVPDLASGGTAQPDQNSAQPYPTCSGTSGTADVACNTAKNVRVNAVRVFNGAARLPGNLRITIATPLPLYVLGSIDRKDPAVTESLPAGFPSLATTRHVFGGNGPDVFFAADSITLLSDEWDDNGWSSTTGAITSGIASTNKPTVVNASLLTGRTVNGSDFFAFGFERAVRFLEDWSGDANASPIVTGSILLGFRSVWTTWPVCYDASQSNCSADVPWRHLWSTDLRTEARQPPGMPSFSLRGFGENVPDSAFLNLATRITAVSFSSRSE